MRALLVAFAALFASCALYACSSPGGLFMGSGAAEGHHGSLVYDGPRAGWTSIHAPYTDTPTPWIGVKGTSKISDTHPRKLRRLLTPGAVRPLTVAEICATKWGKDERHVTHSMKAQVYERYGFTGPKDPRCPCEVDHLISRELGGADELTNLWPEPYGGPWNASDKDRLENRLHVEVCTLHTLTLEQAQSLISTNWRAAYRARFGEPQSAVALPAPVGA